MTSSPGEMGREADAIRRWQLLGNSLSVAAVREALQELPGTGIAQCSRSREFRTTTDLS